MLDAEATPPALASATLLLPPPPAAVMTCDSGALVDGGVAGIAGVAGHDAVGADGEARWCVHAAVRLLPLPVSATAVQPVIALPSSVKPTLPVGLVPFTVAVKVTLAPAGAGLSELASVVVVGVGPPGPPVAVQASTSVR